MSQQDNVESDNDPILQWVTYFLEDEVYGINVMQVQEVLRITEITPVPGAPHHVLGIINLRGSVVTVIDIRRSFGLTSKEPDENSRIIIVEVNGNALGLLVDSVAEVVYLNQSEIETSPTVKSDDTSRFILGVANRENSLLILVDVDKFVDEDGTDELSSF